VGGQTDSINQEDRSDEMPIRNLHHDHFDVLCLILHFLKNAQWDNTNRC